MKSRLHVAAALATALALLGSNSATAGYAGGYSGDGVRIRTQPRNNATIVGLGYRSHSACLWYWTTGDPVNGNYAWWNHTNFSTGKSGFSSAEYMYYYTNIYCA